MYKRRREKCQYFILSVSSFTYNQSIFHICIGTLKFYARFQIQQTDVFCFLSPEEA